MKKFSSSVFSSSLAKYSRSPTVKDWSTVDPFLSHPSLWSRNKQNYLARFRRSLQVSPRLTKPDQLYILLQDRQTDTDSGRPINVFQLKSVIVENFLGKQETASIEFYHVFEGLMSDGKLHIPDAVKSDQ